MCLRGFKDVEQDVSDFLRRVFHWKYQKIFSRAQNYVLVVTSVWKLGFIIQTSSKNIRFHWETFRERCQNFMPRVHKILLENNFFPNIYQFLSFRTLSVNFLDVWRIFFGWFVKTAFYGFRGHFWRKKIRKKIAQPPRAQRTFFGKTSVWNLRFTSTHSRRWKMRVYCEDLFGRVVKTEYFVSRRYYRRKTIFKIFIIFFFFGLSAKFSRTLGRNFFGWKNIPSISEFQLMTFRLRLPRKVLAEKYLRRIESFSHQFSAFSSWFSGRWQKTGRVIKIAFFVSRGKFWQETIFEKKNHPFR